jgi:hypothetical protein
VWRHAPVTSDIKEDEGGALLESKNVRPACFVSKTRTKQQQTNNFKNLKSQEVLGIHIITKIIRKDNFKTYHLFYLSF